MFEILSYIVQIHQVYAISMPLFLTYSEVSMDKQDGKLTYNVDGDK